MPADSTSACMQVKMQSVGAGNAYDERLGRVVRARGLLEEQLRQRLVLLEGYSRISSMIEIEVEMNTSVRATCYLMCICVSLQRVLACGPLYSCMPCDSLLSALSSLCNSSLSRMIHAYTTTQTALFCVAVLHCMWPCMTCQSMDCM